MNRASSTFGNQITLVCYTCVYLRFIKDGSFMLAILAWITVSLSEFMRTLMVIYLKRDKDPELYGVNEQTHRPNDGPHDNNGNGDADDDPDVDEDGVNGGLESSVIRAILLKGLRYFQFLLLLQTIYLSIYHFNLNIETDICQHRYGFVVMQIIGELDCGIHDKWVIWALDVAITLFQLILMTHSLTPEIRNQKLSIPQLQIHKYGVLCMLRFDSWAEDVSNEGPDLCIIAKSQPGNCIAHEDYGSTTTIERITASEDQEQEQELEE